MGLFSVLYLILLPVVSLPAAILVVSKCESNFVLLDTLWGPKNGDQTPAFAAA